MQSLPTVGFDHGTSHRAVGYVTVPLDHSLQQANLYSNPDHNANDNPDTNLTLLEGYSGDNTINCGTVTDCNNLVV